MIDSEAILKKHIEGLTLTDQEREDISATFRRLVEVGADAAKGSDVASEMIQLNAQIALWKSGALSATYAALKDAAKEYAEEAGKILIKVLSGAIGAAI